MTARIKITTRLAGWREWEPNPVLLKELRQAMRNNVLTGALMFLLAALFLVLLAYLVGPNFPIPRGIHGSFQLSRAFLKVLTVISLVFIPLYTGIRLAIERQAAGFELMFVTALPAWRIVRGKFLSAAYIQIMFFSIFLPFLTIISLLQGVDLPTILFALMSLYILVCVAVQAAIALGFLPLPVIGKIGAGIAFSAVLLFTSGMSLVFFSHLLRSGIAALMGTINFWAFFFLFIMAATTGYLVLYAASVAFAVKERQMRAYRRRLIEKAISALTSVPQ